MSLRGGEEQDVDVSTVTEFPENPQIDLSTGGNRMMPSALLFTNLHGSVHIFVSDDPDKGEMRLIPGVPIGVDTQARKWWVRAQAEDTDVILSWCAK